MEKIKKKLQKQIGLGEETDMHVGSALGCLFYM